MPTLAEQKATFIAKYHATGGNLGRGKRHPLWRQWLAEEGLPIPETAQERMARENVGRTKRHRRTKAEMQAYRSLPAKEREAYDLEHGLVTEKIISIPGKPHPAWDLSIRDLKVQHPDMIGKRFNHLGEEVAHTR